MLVVKLLLNRIFIMLFISPIVLAHADEQAIILVSSNALTGPAAELGIKLTQGAEVYFNKVNRQGGILGRQIKLSTFDDGYEPFRTVENTYKALASEQPLALFNYAGTPNAHAILPIIAEHKIPFLMPFTGAEFLRTPVNPYVFNLRASYNQEAAAQVEYLVTKVKAKNIALLVQADKFGAAVEKGYLLAMKKYQLKPVVTTRFRRNTQDIELALAVMVENGVDAIAFVGTYKPFIELINQAYQQNFSPFFTTVSFISSDDLFAGIKVPARILVTEVLPDPTNCRLAVCQEFLNDIQPYKGVMPEHVVFEGYLNAKLFVEVAKLCKSALTRACLLKELAEFEGELGGMQLKFTASQHQGLNNIYFSLFDNKMLSTQ